MDASETIYARFLPGDHVHLPDGAEARVLEQVQDGRAYRVRRIGSAVPELVGVLDVTPVLVTLFGPWC